MSTNGFLKVELKGSGLLLNVGVPTPSKKIFLRPLSIHVNEEKRWSYTIMTRIIFHSIFACLSTQLWKDSQKAE